MSSGPKSARRRILAWQPTAPTPWPGRRIFDVDAANARPGAGRAAGCAGTRTQSVPPIGGKLLYCGATVTGSVASSAGIVIGCRWKLVIFVGAQDRTHLMANAALYSSTGERLPGFFGEVRGKACRFGPPGWRAAAALLAPARPLATTDVTAPPRTPWQTGARRARDGASGASSQACDRLPAFETGQGSARRRRFVELAVIDAR